MRDSVESQAKVKIDHIPCSFTSDPGSVIETKLTKLFGWDNKLLRSVTNPEEKLYSLKPQGKACEGK